MVDDDKKPAEAPFLSRWSQRKQEAREQPPVTQPAEAAEAPMPELPPVDELTPQSDFSGFMHPKVDENLRRAALKKLFSDPHFNVMDGLDTYVDDYSKPDPLPPGMLAGLRQAQNILAWAKETKEETAARFAPTPAVVPPIPGTVPNDAIALPPDNAHQTSAIQPPTRPTADAVPAVSGPATGEQKS